MIGTVGRWVLLLPPQHGKTQALSLEADTRSSEQRVLERDHGAKSGVLPATQSKAGLKPTPGLSRHLEINRGSPNSIIHHIVFGARLHAKIFHWYAPRRLRQGDVTVGIASDTEWSTEFCVQTKF